MPSGFPPRANHSESAPTGMITLHAACWETPIYTEPSTDKEGNTFGSTREAIPGAEKREKYRSMWFVSLFGLWRFLSPKS